MAGLSTRPAAPAVPPRPLRRGPGILGWLFRLLAFPLVVANFFLVGAGTGVIWKRLIPEPPEIVARLGDEPGKGVRIVEDNGVLKADVNTRKVRIDLARGWTVEQLAFQDTHALLYFTGPFFEEEGGTDYDAKVIGDLYFYGELIPASKESRGFADRRYFMAQTKRGNIRFGFGGWQEGDEDKYRVFIGGLGYLVNSYGPRPEYSDPYAGLKQRLHDAIPRERLIVGRAANDHLIVMKTPPRTREEAVRIAQAEGLEEAYYVDQGNKARFIVPSQINDRPRYNLPYMLRIAEKDHVWVSSQSVSPASAAAPEKPRRKKRRKRRVESPPPPPEPPAEAPAGEQVPSAGASP
ncbi:MAG: hypothetical protein VKO21_00955 [Candidatus Sericytochromatia bacterium]|nr:hypothetical protein [Candidatus Sericytochromatia bacterium]